MTVNYYKILKIDRNASKSNIRKAYIKLALETHPDKGGNEEDFKKVNKAYEVLIDENKRREYDNGNENVSIVEYGYDYGEEIPDGGSVLAKYKGFEYEDFQRIYAFYVDYAKLKGIALANGEELPIISDYHLVRAKKALQIVNSYYKPIYEKSGWKKFSEEYVKLGSPLAFMSSWSSWDGPVKQFKDALNFARDKMGLKQLTDGDLNLKPIKGNNQEESPQIPGPKKPQEIEGGKFNDYNKLYSGREHKTIRKYIKLWEEIIAQFHLGNKYDGWSWNQEGYDKLRNVNPDLFDRTYEKMKNWSPGSGFQFIENDAEESKVNEIKRDNEERLKEYEETINLMEQLIAESKGENSKKRKNDEQQSESNKKPRTVSELRDEAQQGVEKKDKAVGDILTELIIEAQGKDTYTELESLLKQIDEYKGEKVYMNKESEITELKRKLVKLDSKSYKSSVSFELKDKLEKYGIATSDLDLQIQTLLAKLESEANISEEEIIQVENKVSEAIGIKNALNKLEKLIKELEVARKQKNVKKGENKLQELISFVENSSLYQQQAYAQRKQTVDNLIKGSENSQSSPQDNKFPLVPVIVIGAITLTAIVGAIVIRSWKKKDLSKSSK